MGYTVFHIEKGTSTGHALGNHIDRVPGKEYSYKNADANRKKDNINFFTNEHCKKKLSVAIKDRIEEGYKGKRKVRKDAVKYLKIVVSGTHEDMKEIEKQGKIKEWASDSCNWVFNEFGQQNVVRASLHMDEKTPHMHFIVVPLTPDGNLSAKEILRSPAVYKRYHDEYAEKMLKYGLARGKERKPGEDKVKAKTLNEFYYQVGRAEEDVKRLSRITPYEIPKPGRFDNLENYTEEQNRRLREFLTNLMAERKDELAFSMYNTLKSSQNLEKYQTDEKLINELKKAKKDLTEHIGKLNADLNFEKKTTTSKIMKEVQAALAQKGMTMKSVNGKMVVDFSRGISR